MILPRLDSAATSALVLPKLHQAVAQRAHFKAKKQL
jgi:hypothetical protein